MGILRIASGLALAGAVQLHASDVRASLSFVTPHFGGSPAVVAQSLGSALSTSAYWYDTDTSNTWGNGWTQISAFCDPAASNCQ